MQTVIIAGVIVGICLFGIVTVLVLAALFVANIIIGLIKP